MRARAIAPSGKLYRVIIMPNPNYEMLKDAIARNCGAILSLPSAGMLRHHKTRFLAEAEDGFWIESIPEERPLLSELATSDTPVGVAFKAGQSSIAFTAPIRECHPDYPFNENTRLEALFLPFPDNFRAEQRRQCYRATLPLDHPYGVRLWRIAEHAILRDRPMAAQEIQARLQNLSVGGVGALCLKGRDGKAPRMMINERIRILLTWGNEEVLTEGRVVHFRPVGNENVAAGFQFKKQDKDIEGRQIASKIANFVGFLQREEIKRRRASA